MATSKGSKGGAGDKGKGGKGSKTPASKPAPKGGKKK